MYVWLGGKLEKDPRELRVNKSAFVDYLIVDVFLKGLPDPATELEVLSKHSLGLFAFDRFARAELFGHVAGDLTDKVALGHAI